jgi:cytochrome bd-type quinol oxidase subunit 2
VGLMWFIPGMLLVTTYFFFVYRKFAGKVRPVDH